MCVCACVCVCTIHFVMLAGLKSKKQQLEHNQRQLQDKIGHAVTGMYYVIIILWYLNNDVILSI